MRIAICLAAAVVLCTASAPLAAKATKHAAAFQIDETTWRFTDKDGSLTKIKGAKVRESIDADGNYISQTTTGKHLDHGTAVMKDGKACFTSLMTKEGEVCWTAPRSALKIGHSFVTTNDKGKKLRVTRVAYMKLSMPK
jgi:hypothetical protein